MLYKQINKKNIHLFASQVKRVFSDAESQQIRTGNGNIKYLINIPQLKDGKITIELVESGALVVMPMQGVFYDQGKIGALGVIFANFGMKKLNETEKS